MSLCFDSEKWLMISLASVAISLTVGLVLLQNGHGQNMTILQLGQNMTILQLGQNMTILQLEQETDSLKAAIDYCFQHADRPNPIQDLIDKGFLSPESTGETCISIKQKYATLNSLHSETMEKARSVGYLECLTEETNTIADCDRIHQEILDRMIQ